MAMVSQLILCIFGISHGAWLSTPQRRSHDSVKRNDV